MGGQEEHQTQSAVDLTAGLERGPGLLLVVFLGSASSGSGVVLVMVGVATVALPVSSDDLSASAMFDAAWRRRLKASTASCGLTITAPGCSSTNMARSSESV